MKSERLEFTRGSGNVYRDLGHANADVKQLKALLAAEILKVGSWSSCRGHEKSLLGC